MYVNGLTGPMKILIDHLTPLAHFSFEIRDDHCRYMPKDDKKRRIVLASICDFWERNNFDVLIRPRATFLKTVAPHGLPSGEILDVISHEIHVKHSMKGDQYGCRETDRDGQ